MGRRYGIPLPRVEGEASRQAHVDLPERTYERELGRDGFYGPATQMYHRHPPTAWVEVDGALRPRAFDTNRLETRSVSPWGADRLLSNRHLQVRFWQTERGMDQLVRNADGDELLFLHRGGAELFCDYGHLHLEEGDYLLLPRGTQWRLETGAPLAVLMIEATGVSLGLPEKGMLGAHAVFDPAVLDTPRIDPAFLAQQGEDPWRVQVKRHDRLSALSYPFNPLDAVGWHGSLAPVRLNWRAIRPLASARYHLPPSVHTTFSCESFVVCTFVPRPIETDPGALKVPFFHSNDDYDELIFYHHGEFFSRDDIHPGMLTLHPAGIPHGPHPKAFEIGRRGARRETDEVAVMIDSREALEPAELPVGVEREDYVDSWKVRPG